MESRRAQPDIFTLDRSVLALQEEFESLRQQLSERSTAPTRQRGRGDSRGGFARTGRGLYQMSHEVDSTDFWILDEHDHHVIYATRPLELTEAYWVPEDDYENGDVNYSYIHIHDHQPPYDKTPIQGPILGRINGQSKGTTPWSTGDLLRGVPYRFVLSEQPRVKQGSIVTLDTEVTQPSGRWPTGYVMILWRYL